MGSRHLSTRHHIVPRSREGSDNPNNVVYLRDNVHVAFHIVFDNMHPSEQLHHVLAINESALRREFREKIRNVLDKGPDYAYRDGVFVPDWYGLVGK